jgi:macrodomain Ter protein organizer (MatP/YcbG family)
MAVYKNILRVPTQTNDFEGIKKVPDYVPSRPESLIAMAQSISRLTGEGLEEVAKRIVEEQRKAVKEHVANLDMAYKTKLLEKELKEFMADSLYNANLEKKTDQALQSKVFRSFQTEVDYTKMKNVADVKYAMTLAGKAMKGMQDNSINDVVDNLMEDLILKSHAPAPIEIPESGARFNVFGELVRENTLPPRRPISTTATVLTQGSGYRAPTRMYVKSQQEIEARLPERRSEGEINDIKLDGGTFL